MSTNPTFVKKRALSVIGGSLGNPSKMPGLSYGFSAQHCQTGGKLRKVENSICSDCYACGANYRYPSVELAHSRRFESLTNPEWVSAMVYLIARETAISGMPYFRWHDSGDLQSLEHLNRIVQIAEALPQINFWLPTKERRYVKAYLRQNGRFPRNLAVRLSASMIDQPAATIDDAPIGYSTVHQHEDPIGSPCLAYTRGGHCGSCRKCWNTRKYSVISYPKH